jgi:hypothetical protein
MNVILKVRGFKLASFVIIKFNKFFYSASLSKQIVITYTVKVNTHSSIPP